MKNRQLLIDPARVETLERFTRDIAPLGGFLRISAGTSLFHSDEGTPRNRFSTIAHVGKLDGSPALLLPVFMNNNIIDSGRFIGDNYEAWRKPWFAFFKGKACLHYAARFESASERLSMLQFFGEDLGSMHKLLIVHT